MPNRQANTHVQMTDSSNSSGGQPVAEQPTSQTHIEIYTDGSTIGNPGPGDYGGVLVRKDQAGVVSRQTEQPQGPGTILGPEREDFLGFGELALMSCGMAARW